MPVKSFLRFTSCITIVLGLTLIIFPGFIENTFITNPSQGGDIFIRFLGSTLSGYACLNWFTAKHNDQLTMRAALAANLATLTIAFLISLVAQADGTFSSWGILIVLLHLSFGLGFASYIYKFRKV